MLVPVAILAVLATVGGLLQTKALGFGTDEVTNFLSASVGPERWEGGGAEIALTLLTMILAAALFAGALRMRPWTSYAPWAQRLLERKYYFDEIYDYMFVRAMDGLARVGLRYVEQPIIDGIVVGTGELAEAEAHNLSLTQTGYFRNYVLVFVAGAVVVAILLLARVSS
jgi:NADH-quinone oxidoreductase subunit L